ncbi:hypothetical protein [Saccharopolyspora taberi]
MSSLRKATVSAVVAALALGTTVATGTASAAAIECDAKSSGQAGPFYHGESASYAYDERFSKSHPVPGLETHIPQGTATWSNWDGEDDLILVTEYFEGSKSLIVGIDARTGKKVGNAWIAGTHVGGIAVFEKQGWAFVSGRSNDEVLRYSLPKLKDALKSSGSLEPENNGQKVESASFLTSHGPTDTLWAGKFNEAGRGTMQSYKVGADGGLTKQEGSWEVPTKTQGVVVTEDLFIYSTSHGRNNRSNIYVVGRGKGETDLDDAKLSCFRSPSMSEGLTVYGDDVYVAYESGASFYADDPKDKPRNIISNLHKASLASLAKLVG